MKKSVNLLIINAFILLALIFSGCEQITEPTENPTADKTDNTTLNKSYPERPFKGRVLYSLTGMDIENGIYYLSGTGNLTHLGKTTTVETIYIAEGRGEDTFTAADGSQINMTWNAVGDGTFEWQIVGGTGRFAIASGYGICPPVVQNSDGTLDIEYLGVISY